MVHRVSRLTRRIVSTTVDTDPNNVAVVCDAFLRYGSAQAAGLQRNGMHVTLYYIDRLDDFAGSEEERAWYLDRARATGVILVPLPRRRIRSLLGHTLWLHRDLRRRKISSAIVQAHIDPRYATLGLALHVALIVHDPQTHSGDTESTYPTPVRALARMAELTASCLLIHSPSLREQVRPLLRRLPIGIVPHGAEMSVAPAAVPRERHLLIFGRLYPYKGVDTALAAFSSLPAHLSDTKLIIAGRGPLAALARGTKNVEVREEYISESDVEMLLKEARLVLLPYKDATQSGVGLQAIANGVPCIVSRAGGLPELVEKASPELVVAPDDPDGLAEAIVKYLDHDSLLRQAVYEHATIHFAWPVVVRRLRTELQRLGIVAYQYGQPDREVPFGPTQVNAK